MGINDCLGCIEEVYECYLWQSRGYDAGLDWLEEHCFVFVMDEKGRFVIS